MATDEPDNEKQIRQIHDQVAVFVKQLDDLMRDLTPELAQPLAGEAQRLLTVATFLRDATIDLLDTAGVPVDTEDAGVEAEPTS
ncbi:MAG: hypothetical protein JWO42_333 [Chloroflexi bacterium]|jgi:hypothetical protein|nr:hypothetical protein [Chloroflexota bacterium]